MQKIKEKLEVLEETINHLYYYANQISECLGVMIPYIDELIHDLDNDNGDGEERDHDSRDEPEWDPEPEWLDDPGDIGDD